MPQVPIWGCVLIVLAVAALCGALAFFAGVNIEKEKRSCHRSAEDEAKRIISNATKRLPQRKRKPCSRARTKFIVCATSPNAR